MKFRFDPDQPHQRDAIEAAVSLLEGQPSVTQGRQSLIAQVDGELFNELGFANSVTLDDEHLLRNLKRIQGENGLQVSESLDGRQFTIEMETGTGKTYVFLRTAFELNRRYGISKFVVIVPSVAIREGIQKSFEITRDHFATLYDRTPCDGWVYSSAKLASVRQFAAARTLQILILNIDAINSANNVFLKPQDALSGRCPIDFVATCHPVVILDEPQNMESANAQAAIRRLQPSLIYRYSATHRKVYNILYRLDPVKAYDLGLVKRIEVDSVTDGSDLSLPYVRVDSVQGSKRGLKAKLFMQVRVNGKVARKSITVSHIGQSLEDLAGGLPGYRDVRVEGIDASTECVSFSNGMTVRVGGAMGADRDRVMKAQVRETVIEHLEKELRTMVGRKPGQRIKVLSLFFIDKVANYSGSQGKIRVWFEEAYRDLGSSARYRSLALPDVADAHTGYFAQRNGKAQDSDGLSQEDAAAYALIMREKERLISPDEPVRFIFSHSALREGWDNPNVFVICTLNETHSDIKKRQEIGRGLRLSVDESGERCIDTDVNRLTVIVNENYKEFTEALQNEISEECGVLFGKRILNRRERVIPKLTDNWKKMGPLLKLWDKISTLTVYRVHIDEREILKLSSDAIRGIERIQAPRLTSERAEVEISDRGVVGNIVAIRQSDIEVGQVSIAEAVKFLENSSGLTRATVVTALMESGRLGDLKINPQQFLEAAARQLRWVAEAVMVKDISYHSLSSTKYDIERLGTNISECYESKVARVTKSIYDMVECDSDVEREFVAQLEARSDVIFFLKLPYWYRIATPVGFYNPDWAIVKKDGGMGYSFAVRETKGTLEASRLRGVEWAKVECGKRHFAQIGVDFDVVTKAGQV